MAGSAGLDLGEGVAERERMADRIPAWIDGRLQPVDKIEAHLKGLRHMAVSVFVLRGDRILLQRRALGKYHTPGLWANTCCTHPHWAESSAACASRRLGEELGIAGLVPHARGTVEYRADVGGGMTEHEVVELFVAEAPEDMPLRPDPSEVMETEWIGIAEMTRRIAEKPEIFTPWLRIYMREHADRIFTDR